MIITSNDLDLISKLNPQETKVGLTSGCFDLLHYYHLRYLERCKSNCDYLIVGIDSDDLVMNNKNKVPVINEFHRLCMVNALKCVDAVFIMNSLSDFKKFGEISDIIFKNDIKIYGNDVLFKDKVKVIPDVIELSSTTEIINNVKNK